MRKSGSLLGSSLLFCVTTSISQISAASHSPQIPPHSALTCPSSYVPYLSARLMSASSFGDAVSASPLTERLQIPCSSAMQEF